MYSQIGNRKLPEVEWNYNCVIVELINANLAKYYFLFVVLLTPFDTLELQKSQIELLRIYTLVIGLVP